MDRREFLKLFGMALVAATAPLPPILLAEDEVPKPETIRSPVAVEGRGMRVKAIEMGAVGGYVFVSRNGELTMTYEETAWPAPVGMVVRCHGDGLGDVRFFEPETVRQLSEFGYAI